MANNKIKKKEGFTIIEVVLVLAIAGLIFLMVFVALPALQSSQRDTQRREDMGRLVTAITNYKANNRNKLPAATTNDTVLIQNYLSNDFTDPDGTNYTIDIIDYNRNKTTPAGSTFNHKAYIVTGAKCKDGSEGTVEEAVGDNNYAVVFKFEGSGTYCSDDS